MQWHDRSAKAGWAHICLLQQIAAYKPTAAAAHNAACLPGADFPSCDVSCGGSGPPPPPGPQPCTLPPDEASTLRGPAPPLIAKRATNGTAVFVDATNGSDDADGSEARPVRSLPKAQRLAQALKAVAGEATVFLRQGTYFLNSPLVIAGANDSHTLWTSFPGERATISGGALLRDLHWARGEDTAASKRAGTTIWVAAVHEGVAFNSLFVEGRRQTRARFPNGSPCEARSGFGLQGQSLGNPADVEGGQWSNNIDVLGGPGGGLVATGATFDGAMCNATVPTLEARPTRRDFIGFKPSGTSARFDHSHNTDYWQVSSQ